MKQIKVKIKQTGFESERYLKNIKKAFDIKSIEKLAEDSLSDFAQASPTEELAEGWFYYIEKTRTGCTLTFCNEVTKPGMYVNFAILLDVGHASANGKWIAGKNYLKEPIKKVYDRINKMLQEVK